MLKKVPYYAKLSIRTSWLCCASTCIVLANWKWRHAHSGTHLINCRQFPAIFGNYRFFITITCVLNSRSDKKEASWIFRFIVLKWIEKRVFEILCRVSFNIFILQNYHLYCFRFLPLLYMKLVPEKLYLCQRLCMTKIY